MTRLTTLAVISVAGWSTTTTVAIDEVPQFAVARIGEALDPTRTSFAAAVSEDGDAVGEIWFSGFRQAFVYTYERGPTLLPFVNGHPNARAFDVTERDATGDVIIVGAAADGFYDETGTAVCWRYSTATGDVTAAIEIGPLPGYSQSFVSAVSNDGLVVGESRIPGSQPMVFDVHTGDLTPIDFPATPSDMNNLGQIVGGTFRGDLDGNSVNLGIPPSTTGAGLAALSDTGWAAGTASMPYTDGAGHFINGVVRHLESWELLYAFSFLDSGNDVNDHGDVVGAIGVSAAVRPALYIDALNQVLLINDLFAPEQPYALGVALSINNAGQIAGGYQAAVITPLGTMIIPGDVNGNAVVDLDDLCAWRNMPIDLDGDADADDDDEQWLRDRLGVLGFTVVDCNANGVPDHCDVLDATSTDCNENDVPDECEDDCDEDGVPDSCEPDCNENGVPDDCDLAGGTSQDCNANGIPDECDGSDTVQYPNPFDPTVLLIADSTFTDDLFVSGSGDVADVDFRLDIDYRIGDLTVRLSHADVTITLIDRPGHPQVIQGNGQLGYRITLDDEGTGGPIENKGNFGSPFDPIESPPSFVPDEALAAFDGMPIGGVWTVEITTSTGYSPVSAFIEWQLVITDAEVPVDCIPGDVNGDGVIAFDDLVALLAAWGPCGDPCFADFDGDGIVGLTDLLIVLSNWSTG